jgi:serine/threonine protein kinase
MARIQPGTRLGHYDIVGALGKGGMGEVWRARDTNLGREVAIKTLPAEFSDRADYLARFRREAQAASSLSHPNICVVHDLGTHDGQPFIVMELLAGESLRTRLTRGPMPADQAIDVMMQLADGLSAAHTRGILHRDIKPANIFVTDHGSAKLLDFGLARIDSALAASALTMDATRVGTVMGTVAYMSPEQARGEGLDARSDLFSLGVVFYEMLTGKPAFVGNTTAIIFDRLLNAMPARARSFRPELPHQFDPLLESLLQKDRETRCSSAVELRTLLEKVRSGSGERSAPASGASDERKSIAVLPFNIRSSDPDTDYFSDGLTDEIITDLSQIRTLRVISQNSSAYFKESGKDPRTIAGELNVRYLLEGTVRKAGRSVRVTARLVDALNDDHLWAEKYSGQLEDIFEIQEQISRKIVDALKMQLSPEEDRKLGVRRIQNVEALAAYHRAYRETYRFTREGLDRARALIERALALEGDNEQLFAIMGLVYRQYYNAGFTSDTGHVDKAAGYASKVFALNPESAAGHQLLGLVQWSRGETVEAVRSYKRALALDPNSLVAMLELQRAHHCVGVLDDALATAERLMKVDPLAPMHYATTLFIYHLSGQFALLERRGQEVLEAFPEFKISRWTYSVGLIELGKRDKALLSLQNAPSEEEDSIAGRFCEFVRYALEGRTDQAVAQLGPEIREAVWQNEWWSWWASACYALVGDQSQAIDWLENAANRGFLNYPYLAQHSVIFRALDDDPRFQDLLKRIKQAREQFEL